MFKSTLAFFIFIGILFNFSSFAQERITGLSSNPIIINQAIQNKLNPEKNSNQLLTIPFIEDFSNYIGFPNPNKFIDKQAFINNTFPIFPPSIGVATLDAIDQNGDIYAHANNVGFFADTLTSQYIRLDSIFNPLRAITLQDSIYFSFYFQPGGGTPTIPFVQWERIGNKPETSDNLYLDFGYTLNGETVWTNVWSSPGVSLDEWLNNDPLKLNYFKQILIPITQTIFLQDSFQFRFRNIASLEDNGIDGWASNVDHWHIDYIQLDINRSYNDIFPNDITFVAPTTSCLKNYQNVPWSHYLPAMLDDKFDNKMANISNTTKNASYRYFVFKNNTLPVYTYTCNNENISPYYNNGLQDYSFHAAPNIEFDIDYDNNDSAVFTITHIQKIDGAFGDKIASNDTIYYSQLFSNFFSYDDGTAEAGYSLYNTNPQPKSYLAVKFSLAHPDTLRAIKIWFNNTLNNENVVPFTLMIWNAGSNGQPGTLIDSFPSQLPLFSEHFLNFATYYLDRPVPISGNFFIGLKQEHNIQLNIGYDQNTDARQFFFYKTTNVWAEPIIKGSPMIRPVVGDYLIPQTINEDILSNISIYPNPTSETLFLNIPAELIELGNIFFTIYDIYGRTIENQSIQSEKTPIQVSHFAKGLYFIKCNSESGTSKTLKFLKQ